MSHQLLEDNEHHYLVKTGSGEPFRVAKKGLSDALHDKIRKMAAGGDVLAGDSKAGVRVDAEGRPVSDAIQSAFDASMYPIVEGGKAIGNFVEQHPVVKDVASGVGSKLANVVGMGIPDVVTGITKPAEQRMIAASKPLPPGVEHPDAPDTAPPVVAPPAPPAPVAPRPNVAAAPLPGAGEIDTSVKAQQDALRGEADAAAAGGNQAQDLAAAQAEKLAANEAEAKAANARAHDYAMASLRRIDAANDEIKNINTTIDPGRSWASKSTGQKFAGILGLVLGSLGAAPDGRNRAAEMLNQEVDRDIDIQKSEFAARMAKGKSAVEAAQSAYGMYRNLGLDDASAVNAARLSMKDVFTAQAEGLAAATKGQVDKQKLLGMVAKVNEDKAMHTQDIYFKEKAAATEKEKADAALISAERPRAMNANAAKQNGLMKGAVDAADELEKELLANPTSPRVGQLRASLMLHLNKLQGGRFNEEINKMNQSLIPGNEGASVWQRGQSVVDPSAVKKKFDIVRRHIYETGGQPPNPDPVE